VRPAKVSTSTVKKSQAAMAFQCERRNVFQEIRLERSGAGSIPCSLRMVWMVPREISCPRFPSGGASESLYDLLFQRIRTLKRQAAGVA
jgi:hypothetical protein